ncbi:MAG: hypothetical protein GF381_01075, partial [Candidatus Pacebacteria bacterium]|nr:hypothetical protein [Candidatus Paceibacterota bacterium]
MTDTAKDSKKIVCGVCQQLTNHRELIEAERFYYVEEIGQGETWEYHVMQCKGCDSVSLVVNYSNSEDIDATTGGPAVTTNIYPSPERSDREPMRGIHHVPESVKVGYGETIQAYNTKMPILCAIGIRTIAEAICQD